MPSTAPFRILVLCTGNRARPQMAHGWLRRLGSERVAVESAGTAPKGLHPLSVRVMAEVGIDISAHTSDTLTGTWRRTSTWADGVRLGGGELSGVSRRETDAAPRLRGPGPAGAGRGRAVGCVPPGAGRVGEYSRELPDSVYSGAT